MEGIERSRVKTSCVEFLQLAPPTSYGYWKSAGSCPTASTKVMLVCFEAVFVITCTAVDLPDPTITQHNNKLGGWQYRCGGSSTLQPR